MTKPPGYVTPYSRPLCRALYRGVWADPAAEVRCTRREHGAAGLDAFHQADLDPLPGRVEPRSVSWA